MQQGWLLDALRTALAEVPGGGSYSQPIFPTLPLLEATEFGQQHIITTFCLGPPPPLLVMPMASALPAVTLHLIWPQGYTYWQPETGTRQYLGGVRTIKELPAPYQLLLRTYGAQQVTSPASTGPSQAAVAGYLLLLEEVLAQQWLTPHPSISMAEKAAAQQLRQALTQLGEPAHQDYYEQRGTAFLAWLARATYEPNWVETALDKVAAATPTWLKTADTPVLSAPPFVAVLDNRPCLVVPSYRLPPGSPTGDQPVAACYVSYPEQEVRWRQFDSSAYPPPMALASPLPKLTAEPALILPADPQLATQRYLELLSLVLSNAWLVTRYPTTVEEKAVATELRPYITTLFPALLHAYYQRDAWQLLGWLAKAVG